MIRQLFRYLLNLLTILSLLLLLATAALWLRSYSTEDWLHSGDIQWFHSQLGNLYFVHRDVSPPVIPAGAWAWESAPARTTIMPFQSAIALSEILRPHKSHWSFLGLSSSTMTHTVGYIATPSGSRILAEYYLRIPYWLLCLPFLPLPALFLLRRLRSLRHPPGTCQHCGYDLRAHLTTSAPGTSNQEPATHNPNLPPRCPECGTPISPRAPVPTTPRS